MSRLTDFGWDLTGRFVHVPPVPELPTRRGRRTARTRPHVRRRQRTAARTGRMRRRSSCLHALACTGLLTWYPSFHALAARYRVITLDQRWHGRGIRSPHFRLEDCADDAVALADALGVDQFVPVGYSMGALVAQLVAVRHRRPGRRAGARRVARCASRVGRPIRWRCGCSPRRMRTMAERRLRGGPFGAPADARTDANRWALAQFRSTSPAEIAGATAVIARFDSSRWAGRITAPTGVVSRCATTPSRSRTSARSSARCPHATAFEIDSGHAAVVLDAARFTPAVLAACASVTRPRAVRGRP